MYFERLATPSIPYMVMIYMTGTTAISNVSTEMCTSGERGWLLLHINVHLVVKEHACYTCRAISGCK